MRVEHAVQVEAVKAVLENGELPVQVQLRGAIVIDGRLLRPGLDCRIVRFEVQVRALHDDELGAVRLHDDHVVGAGKLTPHRARLVADADDAVTVNADGAPRPHFFERLAHDLSAAGRAPVGVALVLFQIAQTVDLLGHLTLHVAIGRAAWGVLP